jgi:hypothetical protein
MSTIVFSLFFFQFSTIVQTIIINIIMQKKRYYSFNSYLSLDPNYTKHWKVLLFNPCFDYDRRDNLSNPTQNSGKRIVNKN